VLRPGDCTDQFCSASVLSCVLWHVPCVLDCTNYFLQACAGMDSRHGLCLEEAVTEALVLVRPG
jgi:hypothetical protein